MRRLINAISSLLSYVVVILLWIQSTEFNLFAFFGLIHFATHSSLPRFLDCLRFLAIIIFIELTLSSVISAQSNGIESTLITIFILLAGDYEADTIQLLDFVPCVGWRY